MERRGLFVFAMLLLVLADCYPSALAAKRKLRALNKSRLKAATDLYSPTEFMRYLQPMLRTRVSGTPGNKAVQEHIMSTMSNLGWTVETDRFEDNTPHGKKEFTNIIAVLNDDPSLNRLSIACHFDSKYYTHEFIGMTDSAVPCSMMMELARSLKDPFSKASGKYKDLTLEFIFFDGEEAFVSWTETDSIYGSRHLAEKLANDLRGREGEFGSALSKMEALILLDLIGAKDPAIQLYNFFGHLSPTSNNIFEDLFKIENELRNISNGSHHSLLKRSLHYFNKGYPPGMIQDDHIPFLNRHVPILHMIAYPFPSVWHTRYDNIRAIDYTSIEDITHILRVYLIKKFHLKLAR